VTTSGVIINVHRYSDKHWLIVPQ